MNKKSNYNSKGQCHDFFIVFIIIFLPSLFFLFSYYTHHPGDVKTLKEIYSFNGYNPDKIDINDDKIVHWNRASGRISTLIFSTRIPLKELPASIEKLIYLESVYIRECDLRSLPEEFCHLPHLDFLEITNPNFQYLPEKTGMLKELRVLQLYNTGIRHLPDSFSRLLHLENLTIESLYFTAIPEQIYMY